MIALRRPGEHIEMKIELGFGAFVNLREAIAAPYYALTCRRVRIRGDRRCNWRFLGTFAQVRKMR